MNRRLRLVVGGLAALVIAGALVAPVVISTGGSGASCSTSLIYLRHPYVVRSVGSADIVQDVSIGVGITRGCGTRPENVNVRSLAGVRSTAAVGLEGVPAVVYVRSGVCPGAKAGALWTCLTR